MIQRMLCAVAGVGALLAVAAVQAAQPAAAAPPTATPAAETLNEIVVTGSRIITNGDDSPTPVTVVSTDQLLESQPSTVAQALLNLPVFAGSQGQNSNPGGASTNSGAAVLNIRNLGLLRTLVLYDGHRLPQTSPNGTVDVNMIPQMLLQRVDVVTGGASAVYGSDAVSGVVNFVTDTHFTGLRAKAQLGDTERSDNRTYDAGFALGTGFAGQRGHFEFSYQFHDDPGIYTRLTRPWGAAVWSIQGAGTGASPYHLVRDSRISTSSFGGLISARAPVQNGITLNNFSSNGVLTPFVNGAASGTTGVQSGGDGTYFYPSSLKTAYRSHQAFARVDYDFSDSLHGYFETARTLNWNQDIWGPNSLTNVPISNANPFLSTTYRTLLPQTTNANFTLSKTFLQVPPVAPTTYEKQLFVLGDLAGSLGEHYKWEASFSHSQTDQNTRQLSNINRNRLYAALDAVANPANGEIVCNVTLTNPGLYPGCVPLNVFGPQSESPAALAYVGTRTEHWAKTKMDDAAASVTGAPFSTWAGPVNMALSGEWRRIKFNDISNALSSDQMDCTGLRFCTLPSNLWASGSYGPWSPANMSVSEGALELDAPLAKDLRFAKDLGLNAAGRYANYSTTGGVWAWKVGLDWHLSDALTLRGTRSRDIRAPNLNDLYAPALTTRNTFTDSLTGQLITNFNLTSRGNPDLRPELADTKTAGVVFRPQSLPGFSIALDGYETVISNAIISLSGSTATVQSACNASGGASPYCALITRPLPYSNRTSANNATEAFTIPINVAYLRTYGADLEVNFRGTLFSRPFAARLLSTYQPHLLLVTPGLSSVDMGGAAFGAGGISTTPALRLTAFITAKPSDALTLTVTQRWRSGLRWNGDPLLVYSEPDIASIAYTNLNVSYALKSVGTGKVNLFLNVQNLFDKAPTIAITSGSTAGQNAANPDGDDFVGRYYTLGARYGF